MNANRLLTIVLWFALTGFFAGLDVWVWQGEDIVGGILLTSLLVAAWAFCTWTMATLND